MVWFVVGYWIGQTKHGLKPLIISLILVSVDYWVINIVKKWYNNRDKNGEIKILTYEKK